MYKCNKNVEWWNTLKYCVHFSPVATLPIHAQVIMSFFWVTVLYFILFYLILLVVATQKDRYSWILFKGNLIDLKKKWFYDTIITVVTIICDGLDRTN